MSKGSAARTPRSELRSASCSRQLPHSMTASASCSRSRSASSANPQPRSGQCRRPLCPRMRSAPSRHGRSRPPSRRTTSAQRSVQHRQDAGPCLSSRGRGARAASRSMRALRQSLARRGRRGRRGEAARREEHQRRRVVRRTTCRCRDCGGRTTPRPYERSKVTSAWLAWLVYSKFVLLTPLDRDPARPRAARHPARDGHVGLAHRACGGSARADRRPALAAPPRQRVDGHGWDGPEGAHPRAAEGAQRLPRALSQPRARRLSVLAGQERRSSRRDASALPWQAHRGCRELLQCRFRVEQCDRDRMQRARTTQVPRCGGVAGRCSPWKAAPTSARSTPRGEGADRGPHRRRAPR